MEPAIEIRRFETPDDTLDMKERGGIDNVKLADGTSGMRAVFEPGWTCEADEKPLLGYPDSCLMQHKCYCLSGRFVVRMVESGTETPITMGDFFQIPAGHDPYVDGSERVELILFEPPEHQH